jgi:hypothetical protein
MSPSPPVQLSWMDSRRVWMTRSRQPRALKRKPTTAESPAQAEAMHKAQQKKQPTTAESPAQAETVHKAQQKKRKTYPRVPAAVKRWNADSKVIEVEWF